MKHFISYCRGKYAGGFSTTCIRFDGWLTTVHVRKNGQASSFYTATVCLKQYNQFHTFIWFGTITCSCCCFFSFVNLNSCYFVFRSLDQNKIRIIKNGSFQSLSRLLTLYVVSPLKFALLSSEIKFFDHRVFYFTHRLLFHNEIKEIEDDGFKGLDFLELL